MTGTLGYTPVPTGGTDNPGNNDVILSGPYTPTADGILGDGHFLYAGIGGTGTRNQKIRIVAYLDSGGAPVSLVGVTDEINVTDGTPLGYLTVTGWSAYGGAPTVHAANQYWIGPWCGGGSGSADLTIEWDSNGGARPQLANFSETYSSTGNPPNIPATSGAGRDYGLYFDIGSAVTRLQIGGPGALLGRVGSR